MKVEIELNGDILNKLIEKELDCVKPEDVRDIALQCIHEWLAADDYKAIQSLLVKEDIRYWGNRKIATEFTERMISSCDLSKLQDVADKMIETLKNDHREILKEILLGAITKGLMDNCSVNYSLRQAVDEEVRFMLQQ